MMRHEAQNSQVNGLTVAPQGTHANRGGPKHFELEGGFDAGVGIAGRPTNRGEPSQPRRGSQTRTATTLRPDESQSSRGLHRRVALRRQHRRGRAWNWRA